MAGDSLKGLYLSLDKKPFSFAVFKEVKGLNFLEDCYLFNNPTKEYRQIGPKVIVEWSK